MTKTLTENQNQILLFIKQFISLNGFSPSLKEIQDQFSLSSKRGAVQYLNALEKKGFIKRSSKARGIKVIDQFGHKSETFIDVPIFGYANAGTPLTFAYQDKIGQLKVDKKLVKNNKNLYSLIIKGDSMNRRRINHVQLKSGNFLIIDKDRIPNNGDVVVAAIDEGATVKNYQRHADQIILYPESTNDIHTPIYVHETSNAFLNGTVIAVLDNNSFR